jgi:hypothetical protein
LHEGKKNITTDYQPHIFKNKANSYFEVLSDCHQNQNFGQNILAFLLFA